MGKNKKKVKKEQFPILKVVNAVYLFLILIVFPLFFYDHYWDMAFIKWAFFYYVTIGFLIVNAVAWLWMWLTEKEVKGKKKKQNLSIIDVFALSYAVTGIITYLASENRAAAWMGTDGWYMGFVAQFLFAIVFLVFSIQGVSEKKFLYFQIAGSAINFVIAILQRYGVNVFYLYWDMPAEVKRDYLSTIGNRGWFTGYVSAVFPLAFFLYLVAKERKERYISGVYLFITSACLLIINTNSIYPSILVVGFVMLIFSIGDAERIKRLFEINLIWWMADLLTALWRVVNTRIMRDLRGVALILQKPVVAAIALAISILLLLLINIGIKKNFIKDLAEPKAAIIRRVIYIATGGAALLVILLFVLNTSGVIKNPISALTITDGWGDNRGFIWKFSLQMFADGSFMEKLFGVGQDCMAYKAYNNPSYVEILDAHFPGEALANSHNEWINTLVTRGLFGLIAYAGIFAVTGYRCLKKLGRNDNIVIPAIGLCIVGYAVNNFFGYQQVSATAVIIIEMGIASYYIKKEQNNES